MTKERQCWNSSTPIWWKLLRSAMTGPTVGILLLSLVAQARSQEEKSPKPPPYTVLYTFTGGADGAVPGAPWVGTLVVDRWDNLYGTTSLGGDLSLASCNFWGCGVVFKVDRTGKETVLHTFAGPPDGSNPTGMIRDEAGNLYGTALGGAFAGGAGTVFKLDREGNETLLYSFTGSPDGTGPVGGVIRDREGNLYGTTINGGDASVGGHALERAVVPSSSWTGRARRLSSIPSPGARMGRSHRQVSFETRRATSTAPLPLAAT